MQLESFLENTARQSPDKTALVCGKRRVTYAELEQSANRLAHALLRSGIERGDRVVVHLENSVETVIALFAILKAGAVFLIVNPTTKKDKLVYILNNCRAKGAIVPATKLALLEKAFCQAPHLKTVFATGELPPQFSGEDNALSEEEKSSKENKDETSRTYFSFDQKIATTPATTPTDFNAPPTKQAIDIDLAALVYTSGSTGNPKGVMLTHRNMVAAATSINTYLRHTADDVILSVLPLAFDYGLYQVLMAVQVGATVILERSFAYPHATMKKLISEKVTGLPLVPTMLAFLLQLDLAKYDLSALRYISNTGAALPVDHIVRFRTLIPHVAIYSMYGLTECKRVAYLPPDQIDRRPDSVGKAMPNTEVYLVDDNDQRLPLGETGQLVVRGSNIMPGYWELPEETAQMLRPGPIPGERVLYTGDLFRTDAEGYLYFVGRKDDMIKSRGEKVSPKEVENALCHHAAVMEAAVLGVADEVLGSSIQAFVTLRPETDPTEKELQRHCASRLEDFMVPQAIHLVPALPKTSNGKIDKQKLQQQISE